MASLGDCCKLAYLHGRSCDHNITRHHSITRPSTASAPVIELEYMIFNLKRHADMSDNIAKHDLLQQAVSCLEAALANIKRAADL